MKKTKLEFMKYPAGNRVVSQCHKCTAEKCEVKYCAQACHPEVDGVKGHLHRTCRECGYEWITPTADQK